MILRVVEKSEDDPGISNVSQSRWEVFGWWSSLKKCPTFHNTKTNLREAQELSSNSFKSEWFKLKDLLLCWCADFNEGPWYAWKLTYEGRNSWLRRCFFFSLSLFFSSWMMLDFQKILMIFENGSRRVVDQDRLVVGISAASTVDGIYALRKSERREKKLRKFCQNYKIFPESQLLFPPWALNGYFKKIKFNELILS